MSQMDFTMFPLKRVLRDPRWRSLSNDHKCQLIYRVLWACPHTTYSGLFHCPYPYIAYDLGLPERDIEHCYSRLAEVGLIEFNELTGFVRLINWYEWQYCPKSHCNLKGRTTDYLSGEYPTDLLTSKSIAEMVVQSFKVARGFPRDKPSSIEHAANFRAELERLVRESTDRFNGFENALMSEFSASGGELRDEVELLATNVPGLSAETARSAGFEVLVDPLETPSRPSSEGLEGPKTQEERKENLERKISSFARSDEQPLGPLPETAQSPLAVAARGINHGR